MSYYGNNISSTVKIAVHPTVVEMCVKGRRGCGHFCSQQTNSSCPVITKSLVFVNKSPSKCLLRKMDFTSRFHIFRS